MHLLRCWPKSLLIALSYLLVLQATAQQGDPVDCFNAQEVHFPLSENDFSQSAIVMQGQKVNAVYYQYQDKYTFWYKFVAHQNAEIQFSVSPTRDEDRYGVSAYRYGAADFCYKLVNEGLEPEELRRDPIFKQGESIKYVYNLSLMAGDTFHVTVLSINPEDCGHFLRLESAGLQLSIHAIHRPCYDFAQLEIPDFTAARIQAKDVSLFLGDLLKTDSEKTEDEEVRTQKHTTELEKSSVPEPQPEPGYDGLTTVIVESADDDLISVGDKLVLNNVFFYTNTFAFKPESEDELQQLLNFLKENPGVKVEIQGHTANNTEGIQPDPAFKNQGKAWNFKGNSLKLSEERANAVRSYLISNGINKKRLLAKGYGDTQKRVPEARTFEEAEQNMRVEVIITGK